MSGTILVTGAGGRHGSTGTHLAQRLLEDGVPVRILVRRESDASRALQTLGAEVAVGDLHDRRTLEPALEGVEQAYFAYPVAGGVVSAAANWAEAVRRAGRPIRTVVLSMAPAHPEHPSALGREQWLAEEVLRWAGIDVFVLRVMALFHENLPLLHGRSLADDDVIRNAFGASTLSWINGKDAAELAVRALTRPELFDGPLAEIPGTELLTHQEVADVLTGVLGKPVRFEPIGVDEWKAELAGVVNADMASHIPNVAAAVLRRGTSMAPDSSRYTQLTGRQPVALSSYLGSIKDTLVDGRA
ncbi:NmrA family NAD(P)-binding protein [Amycolatopsis sp. NPDC088138]|uniref:NmrA family NAD(P)-binding protein n=1 Tax=Amycolatopsis sp. NPDC088138 TaxID=3363938 RepID=UPI0038113ABD